MTFLSPAAAPPLNVQATQASASAPVEVSWSLPSGGAATITGYRIFYDGREIAFLPSIIVFNDFVTSISLNLGQGTKVGQAVSVRAESISQPPSEPITVIISSELLSLC